MDEEFGGSKILPNIEYPFVSELQKNYEQLKNDFMNGKEEMTETAGWHDDMKFLFHLTRVFRFLKKLEDFLK